MKWKGRRQSDNVEDRRGMSTGGKAIVGGGALGIIILLLQMFGGETGQMVAPVLEQMNKGQQTEQVQERQLTASEIELGEFASTVLADTEDIWTKIFRENNLGEYEKPKWYYFQEVYKQLVVVLVLLLVHFIVLVTIKCIWI